MPAKSDPSLGELIERIRVEEPTKSQLKKLVFKAVRHLPGKERNRIRNRLANELGYGNWKEMLNDWPFQ